MAISSFCSPVKEMWKCAGIPAEDIIMSEKMLKALFQSGCRKRCFPSLTSGKAESCPRRQALRGCTTKDDDEEIHNKGQPACSERILSSTHMAEVILISDRFSFLIFAIHIDG